MHSKLGSYSLRLFLNTKHLPSANERARTQGFKCHYLFFFLQDKITFTIKAASLGQIYNGLHDLFPNPFLMIMINASYNNHYPGHIKSDKKMCFFPFRNKRYLKHNLWLE